MNQVYMSGMVTGRQVYGEADGETLHTVISLRLRHRTRSGEIRSETYRISTWNSLAKWASENVAVGRIIAVRGYLHTRRCTSGAVMTEICAEEIIPSIQTGYRNAYAGSAPEESDADADMAAPDNADMPAPDISQTAVPTA